MTTRFVKLDDLKVSIMQKTDPVKEKSISNIIGWQKVPQFFRFLSDA